MSETKFTETRRFQILGAIRSDVSYADAAREAGVSPSTLRAWLRRGRRDSDGPYAEFAAAVEREKQAAAEEPLSEAELVRILERQARHGSI
ncbi:hypothetical protein LCGC14_2204980, partial [marine sediment metagenome]